jgi:hypothetical protein
VREAGAGPSIGAEDPAEMARSLRGLLAAGPVERKRMGEDARRYAENTLSLAALAKKMDSMLRAAVDEYRAVNGKQVTEKAADNVK